MYANGWKIPMSDPCYCSLMVYITGVHHGCTSQRHTILLKWVERPENVMEWKAVVPRRNVRRIVMR
eukprot:14186512-Ditylum_brightwellii.AAC.1